MSDGLPDAVRRQLDPRYALDQAIAWFDKVAKRYANSPPLSESAAERWQDDIAAAGRAIDKIYSDHPWLMFEREALRDE